MPSKIWNVIICLFVTIKYIYSLYLSNSHALKDVERLPFRFEPTRFASARSARFARSALPVDARSDLLLAGRANQLGLPIEIDIY